MIKLNDDLKKKLVNWVFVIATLLAFLWTMRWLGDNKELGIKALEQHEEQK